MSVYSQCRPLYEEASKTLTPSAAIRVTTYAVTYRFLCDHLGRPPVSREHEQALDVSRATIQRYRADFRRAFGVETPLDLPAEIAVPSLPTPAMGVVFAM